MKPVLKYIFLLLVLGACNQRYFYLKKVKVARPEPAGHEMVKHESVKPPLTGITLHRKYKTAFAATKEIKRNLNSLHTDIRETAVHNYKLAEKSKAEKKSKPGIIIFSVIGIAVGVLLLLNGSFLGIFMAAFFVLVAAIVLLARKENSKTEKAARTRKEEDTEETATLTNSTVPRGLVLTLMVLTLSSLLGFLLPFFLFMFFLAPALVVVSSMNLNTQVKSVNEGLNLAALVIGIIFSVLLALMLLWLFLFTGAAEIFLIALLIIFSSILITLLISYLINRGEKEKREKQSIYE